ncbi:glutathione S-transferase [Streptococcus pyogenes]|nr:glutathione S-transferase [Streptococcus pyogenes]
MKLYYAPGTCALACWIAMEWAQLDYEVEKVKLGSEEYLKINPLRMVPALQLDDGQIITQAGTILTFIAKQAPRA